MAGTRSFEEITEALRAHLDSEIGHLHAGTLVVLGPPDLTRGRPGQQGLASPDADLGLYLYQVTPEPAGPDDTGSTRWRLGYLLTPHAADELAAHRLLGTALRVLFEGPVLDERGQPLRIGPRRLDEDGMRALWSAFGPPYRLSVAFEVSGVCLEGSHPGGSHPGGSHPGGSHPGGSHQDGPHQGNRSGHDANRWGPVLLGANAPAGRPAAQLGELVELRGRRLCRPAVARLEHRLLSSPVDVPAHATESRTPDEASTLRFALPDLPGEVPAGVWLVSLHCPDQSRTSNDVALAVAPRITTALPITVLRDEAGTAVVRLGCEPVVRPGQPVFLVLGNLVVPAEPDATRSPDAPEVLEFRLLHARPRSYPVRLRVDGVDGIIAGPAQSISVR